MINETCCSSLSCLPLIPYCDPTFCHERTNQSTIFRDEQKVNDLVKRIRLLRAHAYVLHELRDMMPKMMGMAKKQRQLLDPQAMADVFRTVYHKRHLPPGDFPDIRKVRACKGG